MTTRKKSKAMKQLEKLSGGPLTMAKLISSTRLGLEMSQSDFAKKLGISRQNLWEIENEQRSISPEMAAKFARILGYSENQYVRMALQDQLRRAGLKYEVNLDAA